MSDSGSPTLGRHVSVLPSEVLFYLALSPGQVIVDCTSGAGGHALLIADRIGPTGRLICLDQDSEMLERAKRRLAGMPVTFIQASFAELPRVLRELEVATVDGILADLGI